MKLSQICIMNSKVICLDGLNALLVNKKKASESMSDDFNSRITYGIEGIYIHSDESDHRITHIYTHGIYIGELDIHPYRGDCFDPLENKDMENINPIKRQKYHVWDGTKRTLPANPKVKYVRDFDDLIDRLEYATDTIFDLLWLYNISGLIVEKVVKYQDPESDFGIRVAFTIFGTYVKENDLMLRSQTSKHIVLPLSEGILSITLFRQEAWKRQQISLKGLCRACMSQSG